MNNRDVAARLAEYVERQVQEAAQQALHRATDFMVEKVKEAVSVPAEPGVRATPGAPPRLVSGNLYRSVSAESRGKMTSEIIVAARSLRGFPYPAFHERKKVGHPRSGRHPFVKPTADRVRREVRELFGHTLRVMFRGENY